ncbi:O-methyltransferase [Candidatus Parcubacteria bacterium]|nr:MAG: O-methyltransferase [Candidatus Parcubacteria bacterium]
MKIGPILTELERQSQLEKSRKVDVKPEDRMLAITRDTGGFFHALLVAIKAKKALELGTSTGYSTLYIADALLSCHKNPVILTVEKNPSKIIRARHNFERAGVSDYIKIIPSRILDVLKNMPKKPTFDFALIDADKENAKKYFDLVLPLLKVGGIIATDNMLYPEKYRKIMRNYSKYIVKKKNVWTVTLPIGNGQEISIKTK